MLYSSKIETCVESSPCPAPAGWKRMLYSSKIETTTETLDPGKDTLLL
jgi:hypothetical protein